MATYDTSYSTKIYMDKGGNRQVAAPGGAIQIGEATFTVNAAGHVVLTGLPTADPHVAGAMWTNSSVLTISAG